MKEGEQYDYNWMKFRRTAGDVQNCDVISYEELFKKFKNIYCCLFFIFRKMLFPLSISLFSIQADTWRNTKVCTGNLETYKSN